MTLDRSRLTTGGKADEEQRWRHRVNNIVVCLGGRPCAGGWGKGSDQSWETEEVGLWRFWSRWVLPSKGIWDWLWMKANETVRSTAQCVLCKVYFSARPNKLRPVLKFKEYYPIEHIFVQACSSARKIHFFKFLSLSFSNSRSVISPKICHCIH